MVAAALMQRSASITPPAAPGSYLKKKFYRRKARHRPINVGGEAGGGLAIAHKILLAAYHMLAKGLLYRPTPAQGDHRSVKHQHYFRSSSTRNPPSSFKRFAHPAIKVAPSLHRRQQRFLVATPCRYRRCCCRKAGDGCPGGDRVALDVAAQQLVAGQNAALTGFECIDRGGGRRVARVGPITRRQEGA
jgi:hypothetical protein